MKNENDFLFGIRVQELEHFITSKIAEARSKLLQSTDVAVHQGLTDTGVIENEITTEIEVVKSHVNKTLNPEIEKISHEILQSNFETLSEQTSTEELNLNQKINNVEVDLKRSKSTYDWTNYYTVMIGILALSSIDAIMNYSSFQVIAKYLIVAILLSAATAVGLTVAAHTIGKRMQSASTSKAKWSWYIAGLIGGGVVFFCLGLLRQTYLRDSGLLINTPFIWMLLNNFFFGISILLAFTKLPTNEQEDEKQYRDDKQKQLAKLKQEKNSLLELLRNEESKLNENKQRLEAFRIYRNELLIKLDTERDYLIATCRKEFAIKSGSKLKTLLLTQNHL